VNTKRILRSGVLALGATVVFAVFVYRLAEWSKGWDAAATVLGKEPNIASCATEANAEAITKVIPQIPIGSFDGGLTKYSTAIQIVNTSGTPQTIKAAFFKEDGSPLDSLTLPSSAAKVANGVHAALIAKDGVLVINGAGTAGTAGNGVIGWGKITSCASLSIAAFFELHDAASNVLYSRVGLSASRPNMSKFVIPRIRDVSSGLDVGFALVNTALGGKATLRAELKDSTGKTLAAKDIVMPGGSHQMGFTKDFFSPLNDAAGVRNYHYVKFSSTSPTFAAIALAFEGGTQTSFPVDGLDN
jgi:hypothetical protein